MNETKVQEHTAWRASGEYWTPAGWLGIAERGDDVAMAKDAETQRRIVACVNACAGLSTEALERGDLAYVLAAYKANNDTTRDSYIAVIDGATYRGLKGGAA